jgi:hypothetical protein
MNMITRPPVEANGQPEPYEDLLRAFFRAEMPEPWPELNRPEPRVLPFVRPQRASRFAGTRSRLALAASVAILLLSSWALSGALRNTPVEGGNQVVPGTNTATGPGKMAPKHLTPPKNVDKSR